MEQPKSRSAPIAFWSNNQPDQLARIEVETACEGPLAHLGHRLRLAAGSYRITLRGRHVTASIDAGSLGPVGVLRGRDVCHPDIPSSGDRKRIERTMQEKILMTHRFPNIDFGGEITALSPPSATLEGHLTLAGARRPLTLTVALREDTAAIETTIVPSEWGIRPYSALAGQLRVADRLLVRVVAPLARLSTGDGLAAWLAADVDADRAPWQAVDS